MRCKGCGYSLWNVPGRTCPECGRPFVPGEFEFLPNAVEFCCPSCMQQYYGTDGAGLPVPREFPCVRCGGACALDSMVLRPAPGFTGSDPELRRIPWETEGSGVVRRLLATVRDGLGRPDSLGRAVRHRCDGARALRFVAVLTAAVTVPTVATVLAFVAFMSASGATAARTGGAAFRTGLLGDIGWAVAAVAVSAAGAVLLLVAWAACTRIALLAVGSRVAWRTAWCSFAYGAAPLSLVAIPCIGPYCASTVAVVWMMVSTTIILARACGLPGWKAAVGVVAPAVVVASLAISSIALAIAAGAGPATAAAGVPQAADGTGQDGGTEPSP